MSVSNEVDQDIGTGIQPVPYGLNYTNCTTPVLWRVLDMQRHKMLMLAANVPNAFMKLSFEPGHWLNHRSYT